MRAFYGVSFASLFMTGFKSIDGKGERKGDGSSKRRHSIRKSREKQFENFFQKMKATKVQVHIYIYTLTLTLNPNPEP